MIGCIDTPTSGRVYLDGKNVSKLKDRELTKLRLHHIGFIFQQFYLIPTLTALENVALPLREAKLSRRERTERATALLETVGLSARADHYPNQLSGGEQQRVAIARAIANEPRILLADEPTGEIDTATSRRIVNLLKRLNEDKGLTIVLVTHDPRVAREAHRIINIIDGRVVM
jgi:putative ABC transport system ATP-binding protein